MGILPLVLVLAVLAAIFVIPNMRHRRRELEGGESAQDSSQLQESVDELTARVALLEGRMEFYGLLKSENPPKMEPTSEG